MKQVWIILSGLESPFLYIITLDLNSIAGRKALLSGIVSPFFQMRKLQAQKVETM